MRHSERLELANYPTERLWAFITDLDNWSKWFGQQLQPRQISEESFGSGTIVSLIFGSRNVDVEIIEFVPIERLTLRFYIGFSLWKRSFEWQESFELEPSNGSTIFTHAIDIRPRNVLLRPLASVLNPFGGLLMGRQIRAELLSLQRALDA